MITTLRDIEIAMDEYLEQSFNAESEEDYPPINMFIQFDNFSEAEYAIKYLAQMVHGHTF